MIQRFFMWLFMLTKRLYKKPTFVIMLLLIPLFVSLYSVIAAGESGVLTVGLVWDQEDPVSALVVEDLQQSELIAFQMHTDAHEAKLLLETGKLDAVWIFPENMAEKIQHFTAHPGAESAFITVLERQDSVALMLSREKLNGVIYPYVARQVYVNYMRELAPELDHLSDEELFWYYDNTAFSDGLFAFEGAAGRKDSSGYLLSPLRGILGTLILLCAVAGSMYYLKDLRCGTFSWVSSGRQPLAELGCQLVSNIHIAAVCFISLAFAGLSGDLRIELPILFLYSLCCAFFAMVLGRICGNSGAIGALLPILIVAALVICPVFFDLGALRTLQYLLPPTYYINAIYDAGYIGAMIIYTLICILIYYLLGKLRKQQIG